MLRNEAGYLLFRVLGLLDVLEIWRRGRRHDITILMFHGTADPGRPSLWRPLRDQSAPAFLDRCLSVLKEHCTFIGMAEAVAILRRDAPPVTHGVVFTFDDGYRSNIEDALPILQKHGAPMTVFLSVSHVGGRKPFWFDRLDFALQAARGEGREWTIRGKHHRFAMGSREKLARSYSAFTRLAKNELADEDEFVSKIDEIARFYEKAGGRRLEDIFETDPWASLLTWDEVRRAQGASVCFGSHAMDHLRLDRLPRDILWYQLAESKKEIERQTGKKCLYLAYPDGAFSKEAAEVARECGYEAAVTTDYGTNTPGCDLMTLKRITLSRTHRDRELLARAWGYSHSEFFRDLAKGTRGWRTRTPGGKHTEDRPRLKQALLPL